MGDRQPIPWAKPDRWGNESRYVQEALESTWISDGPFVDRFESDFARLAETRFAVTASNGTTALHMAFLGLGIGPGDEVIVPGFGFMAGANVALHVGATPIFAEVDESTWCLTASHVEPRLSPRTKAILPIHTYGNVCGMDEIVSLAAASSVVVVEDAAEAFASRYKGRLAGTIGIAGTFSFQATKTITTGEGGMVVTDDADLASKMRLYRSHGMLHRRYWHDVVGHNFRLTNLQAALGCAQLEQLDRIMAERRRVLAQYQERLSTISGVIPQHFSPEVDPLVWAVAVRLDPRAFPGGRDGTMERLKARGIETRPGFYAASLMGIYASPPLPICERLSGQIISLPSYPTLRDDQIAFICEALQAVKQ